METIQSLQKALLLIRSEHPGGCRGSGPSPSTLPVVSTLQAVWWRGLWTALKLCHPCCGLLTINKSNSVSSETPRAQFTVDWCLVARSSFINCIKATAWALLSLEVRKSRPIRNVAGVGSSGSDNPDQRFSLPKVGASPLPLLQEVFPGVQRIDFFATAFLSLGISIELSFLLPTYFLLPKVQSVNIPDLRALLDVDDRLKHWVGRVSVQCDSINPESFGKWDNRPQEWISMLVINEQSQGAFILLMAVLWVKAVCIWQFYYLPLFILLFLVHEAS